MNDLSYPCKALRAYLGWVRCTTVSGSELRESKGEGGSEEQA